LRVVVEEDAHQTPHLSLICLVACASSVKSISSGLNRSARMPLLPMYLSTLDLLNIRIMRSRPSALIFVERATQMPRWHCLPKLEEPCALASVNFFTSP